MRALDEPPPATVPPPARDGGRREDALWATIGAASAALVFLLVRGSLIDDAYITLSYARNLAEHLHWGLTPFRTANSATSPLNVLVLGAAAFVVRDAVWGLGLVLVLLTALQGWGLSRLARGLGLGRATAPLALFMVLLSPLMLSIVGMEMTLAATLLVWLTVAAVEGRAVAFGLLATALVLTRIDLTVFPLVLLLIAPAVRRRAGRVLLVSVGSALPWFVFSWLALGAIVPDTLVIKTVTTSSWGPWSFGNGPQLYLETYRAATLLTAVPVLLGVLALLGWAATGGWRRPAWHGLGPVVGLGLAGVLHYLAYTLLAPPPYHWYYAPSVVALTLVAAVAAGTPGRVTARPVRDAAGLTDDGPRDQPGGGATSTLPVRRRLTPVGLLAAVVGLLVLTADVGYALQRPLPWDQTPITTNWATAAQYQVAGEELREIAGDQVVSSPGEIGTLAYYCRCDIVDLFADPGTLQPVIDQREAEAGSVMRRLLQLNFARRAAVPAAQPTLAVIWETGPAAADAPWPVASNWRGPGALDVVPAAP